MKFYEIDSTNSYELFQKIGADSIGAKIMSEKIKTYTIYIKDIHVGGANILKQDALSIGADVCVPMGTIIAKNNFVDIILIATKKQLKLLSRKELIQPFELKELANNLKYFINQKEFKTKIMGVININKDSFFKDSRIKDKKAFKTIDKMIKDGASIIDIGAVSSRPGSEPIPVKEELNRIKPICDLIKKKELFKKVMFSIDSYTPCVIKYALKSGIQIINDITGLKNNKVAKLIGKYKATVVIMHMDKTPKDMQNNPRYKNIILEIDDFFKQRIEKAHKFGIKNIILDVGIGFGKTLKHNLTLLKNISHFRHFGYELLIGASRKSMIDNIIKTDVNDRLAGTLSIHLDSIEKGVSIVRVHDVKEHYQAIKIKESIQNIYSF
ncbi:MAG: dihydropteroate synthase [Campylobacterota bacterium]|nr:dihydropteroate synthase [Campylobacterota bacterium]